MFRLPTVTHMVASNAAKAAAVALTIATFPAIADAQSTKRAKAPPAEPVTKAEIVPTSYQFPVGAIVIVNKERRLYYITGKGEARRYRVAVGNDAERWLGRTFVAAKVVDPKWIPVNGDDPVEGGDPANPLGRRALYLDWSLLRIHGTPSRHSIGSAVSNGCIRMLNEDVVDLFDRVHFGAPVYAINSWADATRYTDKRVAEKIYVDPEARRIAKEEEAEDLRDRAEEIAERAAERQREAQEKARVEARLAAASGTYPSRMSLGRGRN